MLLVIIEAARMQKMRLFINWRKEITQVFTATCFSNVAVMGSLDVRLSVRPSVCLSVTLVSSDHIH